MRLESPSVPSCVDPNLSPAKRSRSSLIAAAFHRWTRPAHAHHAHDADGEDTDATRAPPCSSGGLGRCGRAVEPAARPPAAALARLLPIASRRQGPRATGRLGRLPAAWSAQERPGRGGRRADGGQQRRGPAAVAVTSDGRADHHRLLDPARRGFGQRHRVRTLPSIDRPG